MVPVELFAKQQFYMESPCGQIGVSVNGKSRSSRPMVQPQEVLRHSWFL